MPGFLFFFPLNLCPALTLFSMLAAFHFIIFAFNVPCHFLNIKIFFFRWKGFAWRFVCLIIFDVILWKVGQIFLTYILLNIFILRIFRNCVASLLIIWIKGNIVGIFYFIRIFLNLKFCTLCTLWFFGQVILNVWLVFRWWWFMVYHLIMFFLWGLLNLLFTYLLIFMIDDRQNLSSLFQILYFLLLWLWRTFT